MTLTYSIDQAFALKFGLNLPEASVYGALRDLPGWADSIVVDGETYYFASRNKMCKEMPLVTTEADTMYRHYRRLEKAGVIKLVKVDKRDYIHLVKSVARLWNRAKPSEELPGLGNISDGKFSDISEEPASSLSDVSVGKPDDATSIPFETIVAYLNEKTGRNFRSNSEQTRKHIRARWGEGYELFDFQKVIDVKTAEWLDDPKMSKFLRPKTLFLPENFESYLNQAIGQPEVNNIADLQNCQLTEAQGIKYLDYFQWVRDRHPRLFNQCRMLSAKEYFEIVPGGARYNGLRRWFPEKKILRLFVQAHEEVNTGLGIGRRYVDVITELNTTLKAPDYA